MPVSFITVKIPDGSVIHLDVDLKTRVEEFRYLLAPKCGIKRHRQRLVFAGRLLQDGRTLEAYGIERNSTIHLLHGQTSGGEGPAGVDISTMPTQLEALQRHVLQNPDILQQMLESSAMQSLLNDHNFMRSLLKMDPRLTKLFDGCPELQEMLHDVEFMTQATEALRNPVHVRDVLRSTERSMAQLENLSGGSFDVLRQMCEDVRKPYEDQPQQPVDNHREKAQHTHDSTTSNQGDNGEPEGEDSDEHTLPDALRRQKPEWVGSFDTNAMASMMQDQNMQHLLAQLIQSLPGPMAKPHPDDPFVDSGFLGQMFNSQTIQSMALLEDSVEKLSMSAEQAEKPKDPRAKKAANKTVQEASPAQDSPAFLSGLHPSSPAANYRDSFALFLQAELESPEYKYKGQLQTMQNMGFTDREACIQMLHSCKGNMTKAVEMLMKQRDG